jgi:hypothetical protein
MIFGGDNWFNCLSWAFGGLDWVRVGLRLEPFFLYLSIKKILHKKNVE